LRTSWCRTRARQSAHAQQAVDQTGFTNVGPPNEGYFWPAVAWVMLGAGRALYEPGAGDFHRW